MSIVRALVWFVILTLASAAMLAISPSPDPATTRRSSARQLDRAAIAPSPVPQRSHRDPSLHNRWALSSESTIAIAAASFQLAPRDVAARTGDEGVLLFVPRARGPPPPISG